MTKNSTNLDKLNTLEGLLGEESKELEGNIELRKQKGLEAAAQAARTAKTKKLLEEIAKIHDNMDEEENNH